MDPTSAISGWAGGAASTSLGAVQLGYGLYNQRKNKRPTYEIPEEVKQNLAMAKQQAVDGIPDQYKADYLSNLQRGSAQALSMGNSRRGGLINVGQINQNMNNAYSGLMSMEAQARDQKMTNLFNQNQNMADYRDQAFQFNKVNPYYEKTAENQAMIGSGLQNMSQGFQAGNTGSVDWNSGGKGQQSGNQMGSQYWDQKTGMQNYNPNSKNGFGEYQYQGGQYNGIG